MDGFDDVRSTSVSLLEYFNPSALQKALTLILPRAELLVQSTGRADFSDGFGRLCRLQYDCSARGLGSKQADTPRNLLQGLEYDIGVARHDLSIAVAEAPIHGRMIALRYGRAYPTFNDH